MSKEPEKKDTVMVIYAEDEFWLTTRDSEGNESRVLKKHHRKHKGYLDHIERTVSALLEECHGYHYPVEIAKSGTVAKYLRRLEKKSDKMTRSANYDRENDKVSLNEDYNYRFFKNLKNPYSDVRNMGKRRKEIPIFVIDSDGMDPLKIIRFITNMSMSSKKKGTVCLDYSLAGGIEGIIKLLQDKSKYEGEFGFAIQSDNLETLSFRGFKEGAGELICYGQSSDINAKQARLGVRLKKNEDEGKRRKRLRLRRKGIRRICRNRKCKGCDECGCLFCDEIHPTYGFSPNYENNHVNRTLPLLIEKNKSAIGDKDAAPLHDAISERRDYSEFTCSVYLTKNGFRNPKIVEKREPSIAQSGFRLSQVSMFRHRNGSFRKS